MADHADRAAIDIAREAEAVDKRTIWQQLQTHLPELADRLGEINERIGVIVRIDVYTADSHQRWTRSQRPRYM